LKIGVAGAGAVGCVFGGSLFKAGHQVTFLARGDHFHAMKQHGLRVKGTSETYIVDESFTNDLTDLADSDVILFCVKSNDTKTVAVQLKEVLEKETLILTMQNGVDNEEVLTEIFGSHRVLSAATYVQAAISRPGIVTQQGGMRLVMGELDSHTREECSRIVQVFQQAGISTNHVSNILEKKWNKLLWNVTFNPLSAVMSVRIREILEDTYLYDIAESICSEAIKVAQNMGMTTDPKTTVERIFKNAEFAKDHQTSMLQDRLQGKKMEVESICGYIVKRGEELQVPTPTLKTIYRMLTFLDKKIQQQ